MPASLRGGNRNLNTNNPERAAPSNKGHTNNVYEHHEEEEEEGTIEVENYIEGGEEPLIFVEVNLGQGNKLKIALYKHSDPEEVGLEFAKNHNLRD